jgi:hypothetical protein
MHFLYICVYQQLRHPILFAGLRQDRPRQRRMCLRRVPVHTMFHLVSCFSFIWRSEGVLDSLPPCAWRPRLASFCSRPLCSSNEAIIRNNCFFLSFRRIDVGMTVLPHTRIPNPPSKTSKGTEKLQPQARIRVQNFTHK